MTEVSKIVKTALAQVVSKVYPMMAPSGTAMPFAVYSVSKEFEISKDTANNYIIQISIYHTNYDSALLIADNLEVVMAQVSYSNKSYRFKSGSMVPTLDEPGTLNSPVVVNITYNLKN
jgi:hypothetical protein